jgi:ElaB/YqjD/DUF883 family membrane-anchored ribosome-binding protein
MKTHLATPPDVDAPAFVYPLSAWMQKAAWALDAATAELGRAQAALRTARGTLEGLRTGVEENARQIARLMAARPDPLAHRAHLQFLAQRKAALRAAQMAAEAASQTHLRLQKECGALQARHEGLLRHRGEVHGAFLQDIRHRQASERDRDWLARSSAISPGRPTQEEFP